MTVEHDDVFWMQQALLLAARAAEAGEVPVGAVLVRNGEKIAEGWNQPIALNDPTAHAEIVTLRAAAQALGNYRLNDCTLYVTLEPCPMCAGALVHARVKRVVYATADDKAGAAGSVLQVLRHPQLNHLCQVSNGVLADAAKAQLTAFFASRRKEKS
ncbi:tRNA adenosine(34) deaminase TadA [Permianibacter sp. IMCC34836]|uniref:tRNA adenosine(34) deaminase TadA n=1 Tax=Permianibacter fluminis TaxID=2738515 RepID=UPI001551F15D|nr:tRNA adenosine(34) deaminase TadA [Permianibacter fluminis]NQD38645.1 tRNA adenosine(34) deaminase TadA [Permianibacter fluminis]